MITIPVNTSKPYKVHIGAGILNFVGNELKQLGLDGKVLIISDDNVAPLYADTVRKSLIDSGFEVFEYTVPHGEKSKSTESLVSILNFAAENKLTRTDTFLALGGGVIGDLCGFSASTYMRGVNFIQLPTSLLAAVDSSVGGKTAVNLPAGKNLAGTFYQPKAVFCDVNCFDTLPKAEYCNGLGEVIKYGMLRDAELLDMLMQSAELDKIVARCVEIKAQIVSADEFESGERALLNLGHTIGHTIETLSGYAIPHGNAVAIGMATVTRACVKKGECEKEALDILLTLLEQYSLPCHCEYSAEDVYSTALLDKKNAHGRITLVLPTEKGKSMLKKCEHDELKEIITLGLE